MNTKILLIRAMSESMSRQNMSRHLLIDLSGGHVCLFSSDKSFRHHQPTVAQKHVCRKHLSVNFKHTINNFNIFNNNGSRFIVLMYVVFTFITPHSLLTTHHPPPITSPPTYSPAPATHFHSASLHSQPALALTSAPTAPH